MAMVVNWWRICDCIMCMFWIFPSLFRLLRFLLLLSSCCCCCCYCRFYLFLFVFKWIIYYLFVMKMKMCKQRTSDFVVLNSNYYLVDLISIRQRVASFVLVLHIVVVATAATVDTAAIVVFLVRSLTHALSHSLTLSLYCCYYCFCCSNWNHTLKTNTFFPNTHTYEHKLTTTIHRHFK